MREHTPMARTSKTQTSTAVGYIRVSTDDQALSVDAQRARLESWCAERRLTLVAVHEDVGVSGGADLDKRPGLMAAIDALTPGMALVAVKRDRLARDTMNAAMIERLAECQGARVLTCDGAGEGDSPEAQMLRGIIDVFAQYERAVIRARTKVAMAHKRDRGERISRHVSYGKMLSDDNCHLIDNPDEQEVIVVARELYAAGLSSRKVAERLAERGLYSRVGTVFTSTAILAMVAPS
jgi:DNA invertase Pin-like site-specific DNA recombinase